MNRGDIYLDKLESESIYIIREAYWLYRDDLALLWSCGKDSTALLHLLRKAFFGAIPFPIVHLDTTFKFKEIYDFRNSYSKQWDLDLIVAKNKEALKKGTSPDKGKDIGCECYCQPITSKANTIDKIIKELEGVDIAERSGLTQDKERPFMIQKLRSLGYM